MSGNKKFNFGPVILTTTLGTNILNPPTATGGVNAGSSAQKIILQHLRITNKTTSAATFSLWLGATGANAAGTEIVGTGTPVAANSSFDYFSPGLVITSADFLVGGAGTGSALTISGSGEISVA